MPVCVPHPPFPFPLPPQEIAARRLHILGQLTGDFPALSDCPIRRILPDFWTVLPGLYDRLFLNRSLYALLPDLRVVPAPRMTSCGGKFVYALEGTRRVRCEIRLGTDFLFRLTQGPFSLNGLCVPTTLEAFCILFEHELCHALDLALTGQCHAHGKCFQSLAQGLFGHTGYRHCLPTRAQEASAQGVGPGARVSFSCRGVTLSGVVTRVGKTATVMVPRRNGAYVDARGQRYTKHLVPPSLLTPLPPRRT